MNSYFRPAGDLEESNGLRMPTEKDLEPSIKLPNGFKRAGDLDEPQQNYFRPAGDLEESIGRKIVTLDELNKMLEMGYNVINAHYINNDMIEVEFEYYQEEKKGKGRI